MIIPQRALKSSWWDLQADQAADPRAAANVQQRLAGFQAQLAADDVELGDLRLFQRRLPWGRGRESWAARKRARGKCSTSCFETLLLSACKLGRKLGSAVKHAPNLPDRLESWCFHFLRPGSKLQLAPSSWHRRPQSPPCKRGLSSGHPTRNWRWFHSYIKGNWSIGIVHIVLHKVLKTDMWIMYIQYRYISSYIIYNHI